MLETALARTNNDFTVSGRADGPAARRSQRPASERTTASSRKSAPARKIMPGFSRWLTSRNLAIAALSAIAIGFLVNALALQKSRHPAPLFANPAPVAERVTASAATPDAPVPVPRPADLAALSPAPAIKPGSPERTNVPRTQGSIDQIALLLRPHVTKATFDPAAKPEPSKSVLAAQKALLKLGFVLKPDGVFGGTTRQAIERFERDQGMPVRGDLTPKIMRQLAAHSGAAVQ